MSSISAGTTSTTTLIHSGDTTGSLVFKTNDMGSGGTTAVTIDTSQNVGIGTTSPATVLSGFAGTAKGMVIANNANSTLALYDTDNSSYVTYLAQNNADGYVFNGASGNLIFGTSNAEKMRIDSSGSVLIANTNTSPSVNNVYGIALNRDANGNYAAGSSQFSANGNSALILNRGSDDGQTMQFRRSGSNVGNIAVTTTATSYNTSSDYRLKENITPMTGALAKVAQLKPVTYKWKVDGSDGEGFIAHELAEVKPDCVSGEKDAVDADGNPVYQGIDTSFLVATLTAALQETKALIDQQAETINALTARVVALESK